MSDVAAAWDREAATFDLEPDHGLRDDDVRSAWRTLLTAHLPPPPARIVDLGCGTGSIATLLGEDGHVVTGVDISSQMLAHAHAKARASGVPIGLAIGDISSPPLRASSFDVVICRHVLWTLDDLDAALGNWASLLLGDGVMLLVEGQWSTGAGLPAAAILDALERLHRQGTAQSLMAERLWGKPIVDDRDLVVG